MQLERDRKVVWWNNAQVSLGFVLQTGESVPQTYRALDPQDFQAFQAWASGPGDIALDLEDRHFACDVIGRVRDAYEARPATVVFAIEDILLHWLAYSRIAADLHRAAPDWTPFFFRGGVPLGLDVLALRMVEGREATGKTPDHIPALTWMPGLGHTVKDVGADPIALFVEELERRRALAEGRLRVWVLDTTFTGSTAFGNLQAALRRIAPKGVPVDVTVAVLLPVENNVEKNVRKQPDALRLGLRSRDGTEVFLKPMKRAPQIRSLRLRVYPVAKSLTEDVPAALELSYGRPVLGRPTYVRGLCQDLTARVSSGAQTAVRQVGEKGKRTGDTAHDWFFSEFNPKHLRGVLLELGFPAHVSAAAKQLLRSQVYAQYRGGPIVIWPSANVMSSRLSLRVSRAVRCLSAGA